MLDLVELDLPEPALDALLAGARQQLPSESAAYVAESFACRVITSDRSSEQDERAPTVVRELTADPTPSQSRSGAAARAVAVLAFDQGDTELGQHALQILARMALDQEIG